MHITAFALLSLLLRRQSSHLITMYTFIILLGVCLFGITCGFTAPKIPTQYRRSTSTTRIFGGNDETSIITQINKEEMADILSKLENGSGDTNFVVIDVRGQDEIMMGTGLISDEVHILPLPELSMMGAFNMDEQSFEGQFNFPKPSMEDDTLVFTCKMGGRSQQAAQIAQQSGYKKIINYTGGADDWFGGEFVYT